MLDSEVVLFIQKKRQKIEMDGLERERERKRKSEKKKKRAKNVNLYTNYL